MIPWHEPCADLNWGELVSAGVTWMPIACSPGLEITCGSGNPDTPWARMHAENLYAAVIGDFSDDELEVGGCDVPQPATSSEAPASAAANGLVCMGRVVEESR
jgi:hypothetical protein